jgi:pimeloyl-ACP methyl ester carboxylesterase
MRRTGWFTASDGTRVWYRLQGSGPPVVLCDGIGCDGYVWPYLIDAFEDSYTFIRWHYRGHGNSEEPKDLDNLSIETLVDDLHGILDVLEGDGDIAEPPILIGHSMGCQVILEFAHRHPDQVRAIVPICGSYGHPLDTFQQGGSGRGPSFKGVIETMIKVVEKRPELVNAIWSRAFSSRLSWILASNTELNVDLISRADFMPYLKHMGRIKAAIFMRMLSFAAEHTSEDYIESLNLPVLIIAGKHDRFTPMHLSETMRDLIPGARLVILPEGSHTAPLEMPEMINEALGAFLAELTP